MPTLSGLVNQYNIGGQGGHTQKLKISHITIIKPANAGAAQVCNLSVT